jgi:hypothetical protein
MPISASELPPDALDAVRRAVGVTGRLPRRRAATVSLSAPHRTFSAGLEALAAGGALSEVAEPTGWRALLEEDARVVAAAELTAGPPGAAPAAAAINRGPFVRSTVEALRTAERDDRVAVELFELRLLRVPSLAVVAVWLHAPGPAADLFIPLEPAPAPLQAGASYDAERFGKELSSMAEALLATYRAAERPEELGS